MRILIDRSPGMLCLIKAIMGGQVTVYRGEGSYGTYFVQLSHAYSDGGFAPLTLQHYPLRIGVR